MSTSRIATLPGIGLSIMLALIAGAFSAALMHTRGKVEAIVAGNLTATAMLSDLQVEAEKIRRYEKETFIYIAEPETRQKYQNEHEASAKRLFKTLDSMLAQSNKAFNEKERQQIGDWSTAAEFYVGEFAMLMQKASNLDNQSLTPSQQGTLTVQYNDGIKAGKDRFKLLVDRSEALRNEKEAAAQGILSSISDLFRSLIIGVVLLVTAAAGLVLWMFRSRS